jgi:hypothetical protein
MKLAIAKWLVLLIEPGLEMGCIMGLVMMLGLIIVRSKFGLLVFMNSYADCSACVLDILYLSIVSFRLMAC